jgi:hypothetical protein
MRRWHVGRIKYICTGAHGRRVGEYLTRNAAKDKAFEGQMHGESIRITEEVVTDPDWKPWSKV